MFVRCSMFVQASGLPPRRLSSPSDCSFSSPARSPASSTPSSTRGPYARRRSSSPSVSSASPRSPSPSSVSSSSVLTGAKRWAGPSSWRPSAPFCASSPGSCPSSRWRTPTSAEGFVRRLRHWVDSGSYPHPPMWLIPPNVYDIPPSNKNFHTLPYFEHPPCAAKHPVTFTFLYSTLNW